MVGVPKRWLGDDESRKAEWRWCSDDSVSAQTAAIALSDHVGAASSTTSSIPTPTAIHPDLYLYTAPHVSPSRAARAALMSS